MNYAVILSGGVGTRLGLDIPKQYYEVNGQPIIRYVIETLEKSDVVDGIVIVAASEWQAYVQKQISNKAKFLGFALPGENRQLSIYSGLCLLKEVLTGIESEESLSMCNKRGEIGKIDLKDVVVLIQDAARPNTSLDTIAKCFDLAAEEDGVMPVLPMKDTVYSSVDGVSISGLFDRKTIFAGQAPESFRLDKYLSANEALLPERILNINGSTEPAILAGMKMKMISGDENNYKITTEADLRRFSEQ